MTVWALRVALTAVLVCSVAVIGALVFGLVDHPLVPEVCLIAETAALLSATCLVATGGETGRRSHPSLVWFTAAIVAVNGGVILLSAGIINPFVAMGVWAGAPLLVMRAMHLMDSGRANGRAWLVAMAETISTSAVLIASGWLLVEVTSPGLTNRPADELFLVVTGGVGFIFAGSLGMVFALSVPKESRLGLLLLSTWVLAAAVIVTAAGRDLLIGDGDLGIIRFFTPIALALPVVAVGRLGGPEALDADLSGRLARAHRGWFGFASTVAIILLLGVWAFEHLQMESHSIGHTAAWIAVLGLPAGVARYAVTAGENRSAVQHLRAELDRALVRNRELHEAQIEAERARDSQRSFLGRTSHELRTPLHVINGFAELLETEPLSDDGRARLERIQRSGRHLLELLEDLLDLNRIELGALTLHPDTVPLSSMVHEVVAQASGSFTDGADRIYVVHGQWEQRQVHTDARWFRQIVSNLVSNALKYSDEEVVIDLHVSDRGLQVSVIDRGPGLSPDALDRIFEPFDRFGAEYSDVPGNGLGLPVAASLAEALGGRITVESEVDVGSRFTFDLPVSCWPLHDDDPSAAGVQASAAGELLG